MEEELRKIRANIEAARRGDEAVTLVAVTKTVDVERINKLPDMGIFTIGENRVQELLDKIPNLDSRFSVHLIGHLQTNKVKYIIDHVCMIQSLDRISLAEEIDRRARQADTRMDVLLQVNIGRESQKGGLDPDELSEFARRCALFPNLRVRGLMAIPPFMEEPEQTRVYHRGMRELFDGLRGLSADIDILSSGMTDDYMVAVSEGANMVRVGSGIFGRRPALGEL